MQNASQSDPGLHKQLGAAPILKRAREASPQIAAGGLATIALLCMLTVAWVKYFDYQTDLLQQNLTAQQAQTEAGASVVDHFLQCKQEPTFHSFVNTNADCINRVVEAAQNLKGQHVVGEVTRHLSTLIDRSTTLQALRLEDRHIATYVAKFGFSLVGLFGNFTFLVCPR